MTEVPSERRRSARVSSSERRQWERIFLSLTEMLRQRQEMIQTLDGDCNLLQNFALTQHTLWKSKISVLESRIAEMKKREELMQKASAAKLGFLIGVKQSEISRCKEQFENSESDLHEYKECLEALREELSQLKAHVEEAKIKEAETRSHSASKNWKHAYKELKTKMEEEVSALLAEKNFVWHQFKKLEEEYTQILKTKQIEITQANESAEKLQLSLEKSKALVAEKDEIIQSLKDKLTKAETSKEDDELKKLRLSLKEKESFIAKLQRELASDHSRKPRSRLVRCSGTRSSDSGKKVNSKRKSTGSVQSYDSPKLFSSSFKVPKLRHASPGF